jgi:calnexin
VKPADWDPEIDGEWEAPLIANPICSKVSGCGPWKAPLVDNPKYKGKWKPSLIANPNFKGKWSARKIPNPEFFEDPFPWKMASVDAVAFELWTISNQIAFDNILVADNVDAANLILDHTYQIKKELADAESDHWFVRMIKQTNKKPWLWIVYVLVIAVPLVLFIGYCCVTPGRHKSNDSDDLVEGNTEPEPSYEDFLEARAQGISDEFRYLPEDEAKSAESDSGPVIPDAEDVFEVEEMKEEENEPSTEEQDNQPRLRKPQLKKDD